MAHLHPVHPIPTYEGETPVCSVEFGYKTAPIGGLCYILSAPIAQSTWWGGSLWNPVPIRVPTYNGYCPANQPLMASTSILHTPSLYGYHQGSQ